MEEEIEVRTYLVRMRCPECQNGYMKGTGVYNPTSPPLHHHKCESCGNLEKYSGVSYPFTKLEEI
jgi:ribosomal protein S27E